MRIIIVGSGFSGSILAVHLFHLAKGSGRKLQIHLIEKTGKFGLGVAYGTPDPSHLLNVPAGKMSAFAGKPDHFLNWLREHRESTTPFSYFAPRQIYGLYIQKLLEATLATSSDKISLEQISDEAVGLAESTQEKSHKWVIELKSGKRVSGDQVVLALGNLQPARGPIQDSAIEKDPGYIISPWSSDRIQAIPRQDSVFMIGTGLTMVDAVQSLKGRGHQGSILALSRRGLLPQTHEPTQGYPEFLRFADQPILFPTVLKLFKKIRDEIRESARKEDTNWRSVLDSIRPISQSLWICLPLQEKKRFLRHLQPYWDTHRHRMPGDVGKTLSEMKASGQLRIQAGRIKTVKRNGDRFEVQYQPRSESVKRTLSTQHIINCCGPESDYRKIRGELVPNLLQQGFIQLDDFNMGLKSRSDSIHCIGPVLKGTLWETTAVPELRVQAEGLAKKILEYDCN